MGVVRAVTEVMEEMEETAPFQALIQGIVRSISLPVVDKVGEEATAAGIQAVRLPGESPPEEQQIRMAPVAVRPNLREPVSVG